MRKMGGGTSKFVHNITGNHRRTEESANAESEVLPRPERLPKVPNIALEFPRCLITDREWDPQGATALPGFVVGLYASANTKGWDFQMRSTIMWSDLDGAQITKRVERFTTTQSMHW